MSVSLPNNGCRAALEMRYALATHDIDANDEKELEIGARSVEMTVVSIAARNTPLYRIYYY